MDPIKNLPTTVSGAVAELRANGLELRPTGPRHQAPVLSPEEGTYLKVRVLLLLTIILRDGTTSESYKIGDGDQKTYDPQQERLSAITLAGDLITIGEMAEG